MSSRDILMVLRARDLASGILADVAGKFGLVSVKAADAALAALGTGAVIAGLGAGLYTAGRAALDFFAEATDAAADYQQAAALTLTQVDAVGVSLEDIKRIGREVAREVPAAFDEMQDALFDIFSSTEATLAQAEGLLDAFARGAVAGQTSVQTAARATISIMNAFKIPLEEVNRVMDIQFEAVQEGRFTYEEFASAIGRAIPSATRAGQSVETLATVMAFLTRNGLSSEQAATSAARAFDLLSNPKFAERMHDFGIEVFDASGNFRPMLDVATELRDRLAQMTPQERTEALKALTAGAGGVIQAMRFLNLAVGDSNGLFAELTSEINNSSGAMGTAYDIMFAQPASQAQLFSNNVEILKTMIGDVFLPVMNRMLEVGISVMQWFQDLNPTVRDTAIKIAAFVAVVATIAGVVMMVVGGFIMLKAVFAILGISLSAILIPVAIVVAALIALAGVAYLIYRNWGTIKEVAGDVWDFVKDKVDIVWQWMQDFWDWLSGYAIGFWHEFQEVVKGVWETVSSAVSTAIDAIIGFLVRLGTAIINTYRWFDENFGDGFRRILDALSTAFSDIFGEVIETFQAVGESIMWVWESVISPIFSMWAEQARMLADVFMEYVWPNIEAAWQMITTAFNLAWQTIQIVWDLILTFFRTGVEVISTVVRTFVDGISVLWRLFGDNLITWARIAWDYISTIISSVITIISNIIQFFLNLVQGDWGEAWENIKNILQAAWDAIKGAIEAAIRVVLDFFGNLLPDIRAAMGDVVGALKQKGLDIVQGIIAGVVERGMALMEWAQGLPGRIVGWIGDLGSILWGAGRAIIRGLINGIESMIGSLGDALGAVTDMIPISKGPPVKDAKLLTENGRLIMQGLMTGLESEYSNVRALLQGMMPDMQAALGTGINVAGGSLINTAGLTGPQLTIQAGAITINDARDPEAVANTVRDELEDLMREWVSREPV